jgi:4-amino-4-deoxy-L-arabinose transferase-like glycosyltransferase
VGRYFETGTWRWAILTGLLASFALLTKYLAAFVFLPPMLLLLLERRWDLLRNVRTWGMVAVLAGLCGPWIFWSRKFALIGFDLNPDNLWRRLGQVFVVLHADLGSVLSVLAILTVIWTVWYWRRLTATQRLLCLQLPCVVAFVYAGPSGIEQRHFMPGYPGLLAVIAMAIAWAGSQKRLLTSIAMVAIAAVVVMRCASDRTGILPGDVPRTLAHDIWSNWKSGAIVVPATMEGPAIAELASAEPERSRMLLVRPSKLLARMNWTGTQYQLLVSGVDDLKTIFDRYPINTIIFATYPGQPELPHDQLLRRMVASDSRWQLERRYTEKGGGVWEAYRRPDHSDTDTDALVSFMRARMRAMQ